MSSESRTYRLRARAAAQQETRRRIIQATVDLHEEVGPARTTVAEIARRAGVQRLTVYNHFPEDRDLFSACGAQWLVRHPVPDVTELLGMADHANRLRAVLLGFYTYYRETERMRTNIECDRRVLPALDAVVSAGMGAHVTRLVGTLTDSYRTSGARKKSLRAALTLALEFWTWRSLTDAGLTDRRAADTMVAAVEGVLTTRDGRLP